MVDDTSLESYQFFDTDWESYEHMRDSFEWEVPDTFNVAEFVCDRWTEEKSRVAVFAEDGLGTERTFTFW